MNHICTWICVDEKGHESIFPQTGMLSSLQRHQDIYWRCALLFFLTSRRFNKNEKHVLFTNATSLPVIDGKNIEELLQKMEVEVVFTTFNYRTPKGYYGMFQNQFYEFSILEHIAENNKNVHDQYLILDSDCIFIRPAASLFEAAKEQGFLSFEDNVAAGYVINGLSRLDLQALYTELLGRAVTELPSYHLGEFLLCSVQNIQKLVRDFKELWPQLLRRHKAGLKKLNEEAHTLSYLYYKNGLMPAKENPFMKRIWTNPVFYRNVSESDLSLFIWHLPSEKTFGLHRLYSYFFTRSSSEKENVGSEKYLQLVQEMLGIPHLSLQRRLQYYAHSSYRAISKRLKLPL